MNTAGNASLGGLIPISNAGPERKSWNSKLLLITDLLGADALPWCGILTLGYQTSTLRLMAGF